MKPMPYLLILLSVLSTSFTHAAIVTQKGSTTSFSYVENQVPLNPHAFTPLLSCTGALRYITVDGNSGDWDDIPILIEDPVGDYPYGPDIEWVKAANWSNNWSKAWPKSKFWSKIFFAEKFASPFPLDPYTYLLLDTDQNPTTGCQAYGVGFEYGITINLNDPFSSYIGDARNCSWSDDFYNHGGLKIVSSPDKGFLEISVPVTTLRILTPSMSSFNVTTSNDTTTIGCYVLEEPEFDPCWRKAYCPD